MLRPRVYSKIDKKVFDVIEIDFNYKVIVVRDIKNRKNNNVGTLNFSDVEFLENTGLRDEKGNFIYIGSIVKEDNAIYTIKRSEVYKIVSMSNKNLSIFLDGCICREIEVIGNIYENKELLKKC